jgi:tRNA pseudouridine38-40 synthase
MLEQQRMACVLQYRGTHYHGWQRQRQHLSIQELVEQAASKVANHPVMTVVAGRTDQGVHAHYQVLHFDTSVVRTGYQWQRGMNRYLPKDIRIVWVGLMPEHFHARYSAVARSYRYVILNQRTGAMALFPQLFTVVYEPLDVAAMHTAAQVWVGEHDFSSFRAKGCQSRSPWRCLHAIRVVQEGGLVFIDVTANAFLHHMVRNFVGVLLAIGLGRAPVGYAEQVLLSKQRTSASITAPPDGLYLHRVVYPVEFELPEVANIGWL